MKKTLKIFLWILLGSFPALSFAKSPVLYQWLEWGPNNQWIVRVVTQSQKCPQINIKLNNNIKNINMTVRSPNTTDFPVTVCQSILPLNTISASIDQKAIHLPPKDPQKIVIIGDTGCSLGKRCNNKHNWPFHLIAEHAARFKPDLIIHLGDYVYRPQDNWASWQADFFHPGKPLLNAAPWIFVRGNHELCNRAGHGWEMLLSPFSFKHCFNYSPLYSVMLGNINLFVMDSANADDILSPANAVSWYSNYLRQMTKSPDKNNWLLTHKPFWFIYNDNILHNTYQKNFTNTLQSAWVNINPQNIDLIISGHLHRFQTLNFKGDRPAQVIAGGSGASLDKKLKRADISGMVAAGVPVSQGLSLISFGYITMEKTKTLSYSSHNINNWQAQIRNLQGKIMAACQFEERQFVCVDK